MTIGELKKLIEPLPDEIDITVVELGGKGHWALKMLLPIFQDSQTEKEDCEK